MICNKCGKELEEDNKFCPNCGEPNKQNDVNKTSNKKMIKIRLWHLIISIVTAILVLIIVTIYFNNKLNEKNQIYSSNQELNAIETMQDEKIENKKIETGVKYYSIAGPEDGYIIFNEDGTFESETSNRYLKGNYNIQSEDEIIATITFEKKYLKDNEDNLVEISSNSKEYVLDMYILDNKTLEYEVDNLAYSFGLDKSIIDETTINTDTKTNKETVTREEYEEKIERAEFLNNLTDERKQYLKNNVLEQFKIKKKEKDVEDRFELVGNEIIFTYIYIDGMLEARIFVITPHLTVPKDINSKNVNFYDNFVVKEALFKNRVSINRTGKKSNEDIKNAIEELNIEIDKKINEMKKEEPSRERLRTLMYQYCQEHNHIPDGYKICGYADFSSLYPQTKVGISQDSTWRDNNYYAYKSGYYQIVNSNKLLKVVAYSKQTGKNTNYNENNVYDEYMTVGTLLEFKDLPLLFYKFGTGELTLTGYITVDDNKSFFMTSPVKVMQTEEKSKEEIKAIFYEQNQLVRSHFGL